MGNASRLTPDDWRTFTTSSTAGRSTGAIFSSRSLDPALDPLLARIRESRDSPLNPSSTAIIIGLDVTGSMGMLADVIVRDGMGVLFREIYDRKPVPDPHIMFAGIGDVRCDAAPLQVSQFETDIRLADQLMKLWLEHGGGGNDSESYDALWWFAAHRTSIDCWEKRGRKGFLFTVGDELPPYGLDVSHIANLIGIHPGMELTAGATWDAAAILEAAESRYHVFHVVVEEGSFARSQPAKVVEAWRNLLGQRVIPLSDHTKLAEVIVSAIQVVQGSALAAVTSSWSGKTGAVVAHAIKDLVATGGTAPTPSAVAF